jgi:hypothetical protein
MAEGPQSAQIERHALSCGCLVDLRDGRLFGFNRVCKAAGALFKEQMDALSEAQEAAVDERLRRHAST